MPLSPAREDSLTIAPPPASFMTRISCLRQKKTPFTLVSSVRSLLVSVCSTNGAIASNPALLNAQDRKSTRLNSSHANISYAVFCLKKKHSIIKFSHSYSINVSLPYSQYHYD